MLPQQRHGEENCSHQLPVAGHAYERPGKPPGHGGRLQGPAAQVRVPPLITSPYPSCTFSLSHLLTLQKASPFLFMCLALP